VSSAADASTGLPWASRPVTVIVTLSPSLTVVADAESCSAASGPGDTVRTSDASAPLSGSVAVTVRDPAWVAVSVLSLIWSEVSVLVNVNGGAGTTGPPKTSATTVCNATDSPAVIGPAGSSVTVRAVASASTRFRSPVRVSPSLHQ